MIYISISRHTAIRLFIIVLLSVFMAACGGGSESSNSSASQNTNEYDTEQPVEQLITISLNPQSQSVNQNVPVTFTVSASGEALTYQWRKDGKSIQNAIQSSFVIESSSLADYGTYDVVISNGESSVTSLTALLVVQSDVTFSVALNWDIPFYREDGSDLEIYEIDGYVVAYGTEEQNLDSVINVLGGQKAGLVVGNLIASTYYFAIATVDSDGVRGAYSEVIEQSVL
jgi:hypothetical protein